MSGRYANKRGMVRSGNGRFRKATGADIGIAGECPVCGGLMLSHYDGDENDRPLDPKRFRSRCFTCEPRKEGQKEQPRRSGMAEMIEAAAKAAQLG